MPALIKGYVHKKRGLLMQIALSTGKRFWTHLRKDLDIRQFVWVGWDYTRDLPAQILSRRQREIWKTRAKHVVFSDPLDEEVGGGEVENAEDESWLEHLESLDGAEEPKPEAHSFSIPKDEEIEDTEYEARSFSDPCV